MPTFANTINGNEILAKRSQCDYAGADIQTTYATKSEVTTSLATKQDTISDLATIRSGAALGATAVQDANYVHTDNNFTNADVTKLSGIEAGAEANVQSNWAESDNTSDAYIQNKPGQTNLVAGQNITIVDDIQNNTVTISSSGSAQVQADWSESDTTDPAYIKNKPDLSVYATQTALTNGLASKQDTISDLATIRSGAQAGATAVQPSSLATVATSGNYSDLTSKPTEMPIVAGNGISITVVNNQIVISATGA